MKYIIIPNLVTSLETYDWYGVFEECYNLLYAYIPKSVTNIGDWTFELDGQLK